jgi:hypothetical protein
MEDDMYRKNKIFSALILGIVLIAFIASISFCSKKEKDAPKFFVTKKNFDVGKYYEGQDIDHTFKVTNMGGSDLKIVSVRPG